MQVYTSNASAQLADGVVSVVFDQEAEMTTVSALDGAPKIGNISRVTTVDLPKGQITTITQDEDPVQPSDLSTAAVEDLRGFFGESFIDKELDAAGIRIAEGETVKAVAEQGVREQGIEEAIRLKALFDQNSILGKWIKPMQATKFITGRLFISIRLPNVEK